jgi:N-carbamoyl-L-amino-acid hydrolase
MTSGTAFSAADPARVLADLDRLAELTSDEQGAQRLTWSEGWYTARAWLRSELDQLPVEVEEDQAGNLWATLRGESDRSIAIGSHLDSVPAGGGLDGCLGVITGLEVLRRLAAEGTPPLTVRLCDFAEEEGDQTNEPLIGSQAVRGSLDPDRLADLVTLGGRPLPEFLREQGLELERMNEATEQLRSIEAYLEIHVEQSSVLEGRGLAVGVVTGTAGAERRLVSFHGRRDHTARPMDERADALMAAARFIAELRDLTAAHGGQALSSELNLEPNMPVIVAERADLVFDVRAYEPAEVEALKVAWRELAARIAAEERVEVTDEPRWSIDAAPFHPRLLELADAAVEEVTGTTTRLGSPQLHDAGEIALAGVPTVMLFVQSIGGISHSRDEASHRDHLEAGIRAFDLLVRRTLADLEGGPLK